MEWLKNNAMFVKYMFFVKIKRKYKDFVLKIQWKNVKYIERNIYL